jgi:hypothetical protein
MLREIRRNSAQIVRAMVSGSTNSAARWIVQQQSVFKCTYFHGKNVTTNRFLNLHFVFLCTEYYDTMIVLRVRWDLNTHAPTHTHTCDAGTRSHTHTHSRIWSLTDFYKMSYLCRDLNRCRPAPSSSLYRLSYPFSLLFEGTVLYTIITTIINIL